MRLSPQMPLRFVHPSPTVGMVGPRAKMPPVLLVGKLQDEGPGVGLIAGVVEIPKGQPKAGSYAVVTCELHMGWQFVSGGPHWAHSAPFTTRREAYGFLFAFLDAWTYHRWAEAA